MMSVYPDGGRDTYLFSEPAFSSLEECQIFTQTNAPTIRMELGAEYGPIPIDSIWCVREDKLKILFQPPGIDA